MELLDVKRDYIFKLLFGAEKHKRLLISFLNAILNGDPQVHDIKLLNPEIPKILKTGKSVRLDIKADIGEEKFVDVEIQVAGTLDAADRALQYVAHMMTENAKSPRHLENALPEDAIIDYRYPKVIGIWIFAEKVTPRRDAINKAYMTFEKNEQDDYAIMTKKARIIFIELPKFNPKKANRRDMLNAWLTFLKNPADEEVHEVSEIGEAYEALKEISASGKVRRTYQALIDKERDILSAQTNAVRVARNEGEKIGEARGIEKGKAEGKAEGEKIGEARGIEKGKAEGKAEGAREKAIETAKKMLKKGLDYSDISEFTGLSVEEIEQLR